MRNCLKLILSISFFLVALAAGADTASPKLRLMFPYKSGKESYKALKPSEKELIPGGTFIEVPLDHARPERGSFDMFYRLSPDFDSAKPSVIFFNGGPGGSSDFMKIHEVAPEFNFIYFDQRGTSFSHPRKFEDLLNPEFFSSETIAQDADYLRKFLGIDQVSVYGHSYGTVPATIYGSLFAAHTRAVVLEGVIFDGSPDLWGSAYRLKQMQVFYDALPADAKRKIQRITDIPGVPETWLSLVLQEKMYSPDFAARMIEQLTMAFKSKKTELVKELQSRVARTEMTLDSIYFGAFMYHQIGCQELSLSDPSATWAAALKEGRFVPVPDELARHRCLEIPGMSLRTDRTYHSVRYPLKVPVTYFEGTTDGATPAPHAMRHFKQTAQSFSQLVFNIGGGHTPVLSCLDSSPLLPIICPTHEAVKAAWKHGLLGENIEGDLLKRMSYRSRWAKASRLRSKIPRQ